jgi:hypothetical protein
MLDKLLLTAMAHVFISFGACCPVSNVICIDKSSCILVDINDYTNSLLHTAMIIYISS